MITILYYFGFLKKWLFLSNVKKKIYLYFFQKLFQIRGTERHCFWPFFLVFRFVLQQHNVWSCNRESIASADEAYVACQNLRSTKLFEIYEQPQKFSFDSHASMRYVVGKKKRREMNERKPVWKPVFTSLLKAHAWIKGKKTTWKIEPSRTRYSAKWNFPPFFFCQGCV